MLIQADKGPGAIILLPLLKLRNYKVPNLNFNLRVFIRSVVKIDLLVRYTHARNVCDDKKKFDDKKET